MLLQPHVHSESYQCKISIHRNMHEAAEAEVAAVTVEIGGAAIDGSSSCPTYGQVGDRAVPAGRAPRAFRGSGDNG